MSCWQGMLDEITAAVPHKVSTQLCAATRLPPKRIPGRHGQQWHRRLQSAVAQALTVCSGTSAYGAEQQR
eukprot:1161992-Pelagomonas_calceolata.AAC.9